MKNATDILCIQSIAKIIVSYIPNDLKSVKFVSESEPFGVYSLEHTGTKKNGETIDFYPSDPINDHFIAEYLSKHKKFYIDKGFGEWKIFVMNIDIETGKVSVDLRYE